MAKKNKAAGGTPATGALTAAGVPFTLSHYTHHDGETHFGAEAAAELGVDPARIFKTLVVDASGKLAVAVVPVAGMLDLKAMAAALGVKKVEMADPAVAQRSSGYVVGGISPLGQRTPLPTVIDESATRFPTIHVSAGRRGTQVELAAGDLAAVTSATFAPISRG
ncbi:Cys-tRNA(Pro) deacylase [Nigerium massiliense]|uniref:Cys-tRNA(Pro) deacylase n=1 Tax=Nigerium massiliense TaxID=1522317 RepID=UPI00058FB87C|nr:Cys-tRNA(Pro) deacylase [Nigerium massiliense]